MSSQKEQYLEEFNKYKHIIIEPGLYRYPINNPNHPIEYIEVSNILNGTVSMVNTRSGAKFSKTEHWVRKKIGTGKFIKIDSTQA